MYVVYVIQHTIARNTYVGYTADLKLRLASHNARRNRATRRTGGEWRLVYAEACQAASDARRREAKLKHHGSSKRELFKRISASLLETKSEAG